MRKYKVLNVPFWDDGYMFEDYWLYEKLVEIVIPNDKVIEALIAQGKIMQAAGMMVERAAGMVRQRIAKVPVTSAEQLGKDYDWRGEWTPVKRVHMPKKPNTVLRGFR